MKLLKIGAAMLVTLALATGCAPASEEGATEEATARVHLYQQPQGFNTLAPTGGADEMISQLQFQSLAQLYPGGEITPELAESWEIAPDAKSITFTLAADLKWSDGEPLTAEDVVFSYNLYANPTTGSYYSGNLAGISGAADVAAGTATELSGITAPDDRTVTIAFDEPNAAALSTLTGFGARILPAHKLEDVALDALSTSEFFKSPDVGSGPYVFSEWVNDDLVKFAPNTSFRVTPALDAVFAQFMTSDAAVAALQAGDLDAVQLQASDVADLAGGDYDIERSSPTSFRAFYSALDSGKLADSRVRQAIMYAIDRKALTENLYGGEATVIDTIALNPAWAVPSGLNDYAYDPEKATDLLEEAGWDFDTLVRLEVVPGDRDRDNALTIIAEQLNKVGIKAEVTPYEAAAIGEAVGNRDFDMLLSGGNLAPDPSFLSDVLTCAQVETGGNISGYCNPELDALLAEGKATLGDDQRAPIYAEAQAIINEEVPILPMYATNTIFAVSKKLSGFIPSSTPFLGAADWKIVTP